MSNATHNKNQGNTCQQEYRLLFEYPVVSAPSGQECNFRKKVTELHKYLSQI